MKRALALIPLLLLFACDSKTASNTPAQVQPAAPAFTMTAKALTDEYKQNEVAADEKFKGKTVQISGTIGEIGKNAFDQMYVSIKTDLESMDLQAAFDDEHKNQLVTLKAGQPVKVQGEVSGLVMGGVTLKECKIVS